mmetsp:Transcript_5281/g.7812  ORF Transcript_5281/g.7812 Transcript_5281/m.7812 type:complete len:333 (+) Transcript_5281:233-1231(+)
MQRAQSIARKFSDAPDDPVTVPIDRGHRKAIDRQSHPATHGGSGTEYSRVPAGRRNSLIADMEASGGTKGEKALQMCLIAGKLLAVGDTDDAYDVYCDVLAIDSHNIKALSALAVLNHKRGMFDAARTLYNRCLRADPTRCKTAYNLGRLEHECKNFPAALELYRVTLQMDPDDETACSALAYEGLLQQEIFGDIDAAHKCYKNSLARNSEHVRSLDHKCALLVLCGKAEEAKCLHDTVRMLDPSHGLTCLCPYTSSLFSGDLLDERRPAASPGSSLVCAVSALSDVKSESSSLKGHGAGQVAHYQTSSRPKSSSLTKMFKLKVLGSGGSPH